MRLVPKWAKDLGTDSWNALADPVTNTFDVIKGDKTLKEAASDTWESWEEPAEGLFASNPYRDIPTSKGEFEDRVQYYQEGAESTDEAFQSIGTLEEGQTPVGDLASIVTEPLSDIATNPVGAAKSFFGGEYEGLGVNFGLGGLFDSDSSSGSTQVSSSTTESTATTAETQLQQLVSAVNNERGTATSSTQEGSQKTTGTVLDETGTVSDATGKRDTAGQALSEQVQTQTTLDPEVRELLVEQLREVKTEVDTAPIVAELRRKQEKNIQQASTRLAAATGSTQNSLVNAAKVEQLQDMESQLASTAATLKLQARAQATGEVTAIADVLKGAVTTAQSSSVNTTTQEELTSALESVIGSSLSTQEQGIVSASAQAIEELMVSAQSTDQETSTQATQAINEIVDALSESAAEGWGTDSPGLGAIIFGQGGIVGGAASIIGAANA